MDEVEAEENDWRDDEPTVLWVHLILGVKPHKHKDQNDQERSDSMQVDKEMIRITLRILKKKELKMMNLN